MYLQYGNLLSDLDRTKFWDSMSWNARPLIEIEKKIKKEKKTKETFAYKLWNGDSGYNSTQDNNLWFKLDKNEIKEVGIRNIELSKRTLRGILKKLSHYENIKYLILNNSVLEIEKT